jgi:hypothetical protein
MSDTYTAIKFINNNDKTLYAELSSHTVLIGDLLRILSLLFLGLFVFRKSSSSFKNFLLTYSISSFFIGFFAYNHGHTGRGISEYILATVFLIFFIKH